MPSFQSIFWPCFTLLFALEKYQFFEIGFFPESKTQNSFAFIFAIFKQSGDVEKPCSYRSVQTTSFFSVSLCWKFRRSQTCFVYTLIFGYPSYLFWASPHPFWASPITFELLPIPFELLPIPFELLPIPFELLPIPFELLPNTSELFTTLSSFSPIL